MVEISKAQRKKRDNNRREKLCKIPSSLRWYIPVHSFFFVPTHQKSSSFPTKSKDNSIGMANYWLAMLKQRYPSSPKCQCSANSPLSEFCMKILDFSPFRNIAQEISARIMKPWHCQILFPTAQALIHPVSTQFKFTSQSYMGILPLTAKQKQKIDRVFQFKCISFV